SPVGGWRLGAAPGWSDGGIAGRSVQSSRGLFWRLIQRGGIGDPLAAWLTRAGSDNERGGADQSLLHGGCGLDGEQLLHERLVDATTKLAEGRREHKGHWRARG